MINPTPLHRLASWILSWPRSAKRACVLGLDVWMCALAVWIAFDLRQEALTGITPVMLIPMLASVAMALPIFIVSGLYRAIFRYSGMPAILAVARAMFTYGALYAVIFTGVGIEGVPRSVGLIQPMVLFLMTGGSRALARIWLGGLYAQQIRKASLPQALIYGAGSAGRQLASALANSPEMRVVGFLDDDKSLHGHEINGLPIYNPARLGQLLGDVHVSDLLLALPSVARARRNEILNDLKHHKLAVRTLPGMADIVTGKVTLSDLRDLGIDDLLGREPVKPNGLLLNINTHRKIVLVTGAGGSIGSELCRQILKSQPRQLLLVDHSEFSLYQIHQELKKVLSMVDDHSDEDESRMDAQIRGVVASTEIVPLLASVCDEVRMREIMDTWRPDTVYHAAAYKHVPLVEHNPAEGIRNNVWGTWICAQEAMRMGVRNFVLISTDKAVRPTNIMGATKRLAEMVLQALSQVNMAVACQGGHTPAIRTCFSMVRFGNVLGSSGSVVPLFREQIRSGGPITLTHPEITRFFMTIPEAAQLVIQAGAMGSGGDVFVLDMGQSVKIMDLARRMIELSGLSLRDELHPAGDIEIAITGLRPGEKLFEELLIGDNPRPTQHPRIMKAHESFMTWPVLEKKLQALSMAMGVNDVPVIRQMLQQLVSDYQPSGEVVDWVHLAQERQAQAAT
jgi:FlaA1/EpsC-like NDP-sugar epimerase